MKKFLMAASRSSKPKPPGVVQKLQQHTEGLATRISQLVASLQEADIKALYYEKMVRTAILKKNKIQISMTEKDNPLENAIVERISRTIKEELLHHLSVSSLNEAIMEMRKAVFIYKSERHHMSCDMLTSDEAHGTTGIM
jgi:putative transposase